MITVTELPPAMGYFHERWVDENTLPVNPEQPDSPAAYTEAAELPQTLEGLRAAAYSRFVEAGGFPSMDQEAWRYTSFRGLAKAHFSVAEPLTVSPREVEVHAIGGAYRMVFVDGRLQESDVPAQVKPLNQQEALLESHLATSPGLSNPFIALNQAFAREGVFVTGALDKPLHLLYVCTGQAITMHPRVVVQLKGEATLFETYVSLKDGAYFTNPVVDVALDEGAVLHYYKVQNESREAFHVGAIQVRQARDSQFHAHVISLGGGLVRQDISVLLGGQGAHCTLNGLNLVAGTQHVDNATFIDHAVPNCSSNELYKTILDNKATAGFTGKVLVRQDAQKTDAHQTNKNLLLSTDAVVNTRPQLQIYADDGKCTHGAAVGQLDANALFYLVSRGLDPHEARGMLTYAFGSEIVDAIPVDSVRDRLQAILWARLKERP